MDEYPNKSKKYEYSRHFEYITVRSLPVLTAAQLSQAALIKTLSTLLT
jgi:hypothetical protein